MRVKAGSDYVAYMRQLLGESSAPAIQKSFTAHDFGDYDLQLFDDVASMHTQIRLRDAECGLSRLVAGYAWEWKTKSDKLAYDIKIGDSALRWNSVQTDWIASPKSLDEVGSIHTVQGYDLNYAGVIVGPDLRYDTSTGALFVDRASYFDKKGKEDNKRLDKKYTDDDLLRFIRNIYVVLLTRGIRGTYVYVCDPALRTHLQQFLPRATR